MSYATESSVAGISYAGDHHGAGSPRSMSGSAPFTSYSSNIPPKATSPHGRKITGLQPESSDLRPSIIHNPIETPRQWHGGQHHMQTTQQYQQLRNPSSRGSWDMSSYLESQPVNPSGVPIQNQNLNYETQGSRETNVADLTDSRPNNTTTMARNLSSHNQQGHQMPRT